MMASRRSSRPRTNAVSAGQASHVVMTPDNTDFRSYYAAISASSPLTSTAASAGALSRSASGSSSQYFQPSTHANVFPVAFGYGFLPTPPPLPAPYAISSSSPFNTPTDMSHAILRGEVARQFAATLAQRHNLPGAHSTLPTNNNAGGYNAAGYSLNVMHAHHTTMLGSSFSSASNAGSRGSAESSSSSAAERVANQAGAVSYNRVSLNAVTQSPQTSNGEPAREVKRRSLGVDKPSQAVDVNCFSTPTSREVSNLERHHGRRKRIKEQHPATALHAGNVLAAEARAPAAATPGKLAVNHSVRYALPQTDVPERRQSKATSSKTPICGKLSGPTPTAKTSSSSSMSSKCLQVVDSDISFAAVETRADASISCRGSSEASVNNFKRGSALNVTNAVIEAGRTRAVTPLTAARSDLPKQNVVADKSISVSSHAYHPAAASTASSEPVSDEVTLVTVDQPVSYSARSLRRRPLIKTTAADTSSPTNDADVGSTVDANVQIDLRSEKRALHRSDVAAPARPNSSSSALANPADVPSSGSSANSSMTLNALQANTNVSPPPVSDPLTAGEATSDVSNAHSSNNVTSSNILRSDDLPLVSSTNLHNRQEEENSNSFDLLPAQTQISSPHEGAVSDGQQLSSVLLPIGGLRKSALPATQSARRLHKELAEITLDPPPNITAAPKGDNLHEWVATIVGPLRSVYEGGIFFLDIHFPDNYPFKPPKLIFRSRIYHCNINSHGTICLDILKENWSPALTISKVLLSVTSLLTDCNPADPLVGSIAHQFIHNREEHDKTARMWTKRYAAL